MASDTESSAETVVAHIVIGATLFGVAWFLSWGFLRTTVGLSVREAIGIPVTTAVLAAGIYYYVAI